MEEARAIRRRDTYTHIYIALDRFDIYIYKLLTGPSLALFKVINWSKSKLSTGPRSFSHYKIEVSGNLFLLNYHCVCVCVGGFFVSNYLAIF